MEQLLWSALQPLGTPPEPREGHIAAVLGRYLFVSGGCGVQPVPQTGPAGAASGGATAAAAAGAGSLLGPQMSTVESLQGAAAGSVSSASVPSAAAASSAANAAGSAPGAVVGKRLTDTFVLDMYSGPCWEQLHDGSSLNAMWLKQVRMGPTFQLLLPRHHGLQYCSLSCRSGACAAGQQYSIRLRLQVILLTPAAALL